jgi:hypothetical protein
MVCSWERVLQGNGITDLRFERSKAACIGKMNVSALWHRLRGAGVFAAPPEVSAIAATSGYYLPILWVENGRPWKVVFRFYASIETVYGSVVAPAECNSAIQQITNLRYQGTVHGNNSVLGPEETPLVEVVSPVAASC